MQAGGHYIPSNHGGVYVLHLDLPLNLYNVVLAEVPLEDSSQVVLYVDVRNYEGQGQNS